MNENGIGLYFLNEISPKEYFNKHMPHVSEEMVNEFIPVFNLPNIPIVGINPPKLYIPMSGITKTVTVEKKTNMIRYVELYGFLNSLKEDLDFISIKSQNDQFAFWFDTDPGYFGLVVAHPEHECLNADDIVHEYKSHLNTEGDISRDFVMLINGGKMFPLIGYVFDGNDVILTFSKNGY